MSDGDSEWGAGSAAFALGEATERAKWEARVRDLERALAPLHGKSPQGAGPIEGPTIESVLTRAILSQNERAIVAERPWCATCGSTLVAHDLNQWVCINEGCSARNKTVTRSAVWSGMPSVRSSAPGEVEAAPASVQEVCIPPVVRETLERFYREHPVVDPDSVSAKLAAVVGALLRRLDVREVTLAANELGWVSPTHLWFRDEADGSRTVRISADEPTARPALPTPPGPAPRRKRGRCRVTRDGYRCLHMRGHGGDHEFLPDVG